MLSPYKKGTLIQFLLENQVLKFGSFKTKSGRTSPFFLNFGSIDSGTQLKELSKFFVEYIIHSDLPESNVIFGPAYKGIPLAVMVSSLLQENVTVPLHFCYDRKEAKEHGEGGTFIGREFQAGDTVLIVEDVITAGTTILQIAPKIRACAGVSLCGMLVVVDRQEVATDGDTQTASSKLAREINLPIHSLLTISEIIDYLSQPNPSGFSLTAEQKAQCAEYAALYGVKGS